MPSAPKRTRYFDNTTLRIRPATGLFEQVAWDSRFPTPFSGGNPRTLKLGSGQEQIRIRRMVYGRDLSRLSFARKLRGQKAPVIECVSIDTSSKQRGLQKLVIARWPDTTSPVKTKAVKRAAKTTVAPAGNVSQTETLRFPIAGIKNRAQLMQIAQNLYQEIGRQEVGGNFSTADLASFNTDNGQDPDLLALMPGDAVQILVDRGRTTSELQRQQALSFSQAVDDISKRLGQGNPSQGDKTLARVLVATARNSVVELQNTFRIKNVKYTLADSGKISVDADFENYIEVRSGAVNPQPTQSTSPPTARST